MSSIAHTIINDTLTLGPRVAYAYLNQGVDARIRPDKLGDPAAQASLGDHIHHHLTGDPDVDAAARAGRELLAAVAQTLTRDRDDLEAKLRTAAADQRTAAATWVAEGMPETAASCFLRAEGIDEAIEVLTAHRGRQAVGATR